jgi:hypothetical protein
VRHARSASASLVAFTLVVGAFQASATTPALAPVPGTSCRVFPADNVWNMDVSKLPVAKKNKVWKRTMHAGSTFLHPDFGPPAYGMPFDVEDDSHPKVHIDFGYASESDPGPYPFGSDTHIEDGSDRHALIVDRGTCMLYELYGAAWNGGAPAAGSGAIFHLEGTHANDLRPAGWTSADAAGLPIFPGLVRWDEVAAGSIRHAIRFTVDCTTRHYLWPARHQAGSDDTHCPPMGARFRLKAGFDTSGYSGDAKVILTAMKHFGMVVADNGSDWYFQGALNPHWTNGLMDELKSIPAGAFVAIDESDCRVSPGSAEFSYGPGCPAPSE